jgi:hypothetical protein
MSLYPNTFIEHFPKISQSNVKDIWSVDSVSAFDETHKDLYMKLSKQAEEIAALTNLCQTFKAQADEASSLKGGISSEFIALKGDISSEIIALKGDIECKIITVKGDINCEINSLKAEIKTLKRAQVEMKAEMSSLLSGDFYIHAGGSPHGKISTKSGGTGGYCSLLSQDHLINVFTGYDVAADGTVKVNCPGRDDCYPLTQRWSFERATDKLINHPDGSHRLMSISLNK